MPGFCEGITFGRKCITAQKSIIVVPGLNSILDADTNRTRIIAIPPDKDDLLRDLYLGKSDGDPKGAGQALKLSDTLIMRIEDWGPVITDAWDITLIGDQGTVTIIEIFSTFCPEE